MKITRVETIFADHYLFVKVHTDAGITGLGESGAWVIWRLPQPWSRPLHDIWPARIHYESNTIGNICIAGRIFVARR